MKWRTEPYYEYIKRTRTALAKWHTWFAWHPITLHDDHTRVWLEKVERRVLYWYGEDVGHIPVYEYRVIK